VVVFDETAHALSTSATAGLEAEILTQLAHGAFAVANGFLYTAVVHRVADAHVHWISPRSSIDAEHPIGTIARPHQIAWPIAGIGDWQRITDRAFSIGSTPRPYKVCCNMRAMEGHLRRTHLHKGGSADSAFGSGGACRKPDNIGVVRRSLFADDVGVA
jgi:hypothetical protein